MNKHNIQRMLAGEYWVHWTYTEEEWRRFAAEEWRKARRMAPVVGGCFLLLAIACSLTLVLEAGNLGASWMVIAPLVGPILAAVLLAFLNRYYLYWKRLLQRTSYIYIGDLGFYRPEGYTPLSRLSSVECRQEVLIFKCPTLINPQKSIEVPVPKGREGEEEARRVIRQLQEWMQRRS